MLRIFNYLMSYTIRSDKKERGATMVEYGLLVALIALVAMVGAALLGVSLNDLFGGVATTIDTQVPE